MNIDDAIKILHKDSVMRRRLSFFDLADAERLGIEALKNYQSMKQMDEIAETFKLPGETEK